MRKWIIAVAILLTVPMVGAAATIVRGPEQEQLVEGHTVFTVVQVRNDTGNARAEFAAAVAVLVRENVRTITYADRFPGVLWFNDQYLVNPSGGSVNDNNQIGARYPCGAVIAVNAGDQVPLDANGIPTVPAGATYVESYRITDPNEQDWDVDKWSVDPDADPLTANSYLMWSVATGTGTGYSTPDNGTSSCGATTDSAGCNTPLLPFTDETPRRPDGYSGAWPTNRSDVYHDDGGYATGQMPGTTSAGEDAYAEGRIMCSPLAIPGGSSAPSYSKPVYNAVLYFFLADLTDPGAVKDHNGADATDGTACQAPTAGNAWPCPGGDDDNEGNSHNYNAENSWPRQLSDGYGNHGGSTTCGPDAGTGAQGTHATCNIDIYFGYKAATLPAVRQYRVFDMEGRTAPYHCHDDMVDPANNRYCNEGDFNSAL